MCLAYFPVIDELPALECNRFAAFGIKLDSVIFRVQDIGNNRVGKSILVEFLAPPAPVSIGLGSDFARFTASSIECHFTGAVWAESRNAGTESRSTKASFFMICR